MKTSTFLYAALFAAAAVQAHETPGDLVKQFSSASIPAPPLDVGKRMLTTISHDQVRPFAQPKPTSNSDKTAVKFKPMLRVTNGCQPYPAVNEAGETSGGLDITGPSRGRCKGSGYGSQVYARSAWCKGTWAIMYVWYFPKDSPSHSLGHSHDLEHVIVWINNPAVANPSILAVTVADGDEYNKKDPPDAKFVDGTSIKLSYGKAGLGTNRLRFTTKGGSYQDLITWDQLSKKARHAFNTVSWGEDKMPLSNEKFHSKLRKAWPFGPKK